MSTRDEIIEGAARAFWVDAYTRHVEEDWPECKTWCRWCLDGLTLGRLTEAEANACKHMCPFGTHARPGPGEDWTDFAPPTREDAFRAAQILAQRIEASDPAVLLHGIGAWFEASKHWPSPPHLFGHYLAMEAMGHGVSWSDDHGPHGLRVPRMEFYV